MVENLQKDLTNEITRYDKKLTSTQKKESLLSPQNNSNSIFSPYKGELFVPTRVFDPSIDYAQFDKIIFVQAENLTSHADYLVQEEVFKAIAELFNAVDTNKTEFIFDTNTTDLEFFESLKKLNREEYQNNSIFCWYGDFLEQEAKIRQSFNLPPYTNLLLLTSHQKSSQKALEFAEAAKKTLQSYFVDMKEVKMSNPYPAKFLKRKNPATAEPTSDPFPGCTTYSNATFGLSFRYPFDLVWAGRVRI